VAVAVDIGRVEEVDAEIEARCSAAIDSASSTGPHVPPIAHAPKLTVETFQPVRPRGRYCMGSLQVEAKW
jgi:hypothetical protein